MRLLDSNIIIYSANPDFSFIRTYISQAKSFVASVSLIEVLGYSKLDANDKKYFNAVFKLIPVIPLTDIIIHEAIAIRQAHNISLADSIIAVLLLLLMLSLLREIQMILRILKS